MIDCMWGIRFICGMVLWWTDTLKSQLDPNQYSRFFNHCCI